MGVDLDSFFKSLVRIFKMIVFLLQSMIKILYCPIPTIVTSKTKLCDLHEGKMYCRAAVLDCEFELDVANKPAIECVSVINTSLK